MHDALQAMFEADARHLRAIAPSPPPPWRIAQNARANAARRMARRLRWTWRAATFVFVAAAIPFALSNPRALPVLVAPLLLGAIACWREEPGALEER